MTRASARGRWPARSASLAGPALFLPASLLLALFLLALSTFIAPPAHAHASLVSTDPEEGAVLARAPETITLSFDEPITLNAESTTLYDATGTAVDSAGRSVDEAVTVAPGAALDDGTYVLVYRVVSADGHPIAGSLTFSVGAPSEDVVPPEGVTIGPDRALAVLQGTVQGLSYLALLLAAGLAVFLVLLLPAAPVLGQVRRRIVRVVKGAAAVAIAGFFLLVPIGTTYQQGTGLKGLTVSTSWHLATPDALVFVLVVFGLGVTVGLLGDDPPDGRDRWTIPVLVGTSLAAVAIVGHTRAYGPAALVMAADVIHVAAAAVWFGGLVGLALTLAAVGERDRLAVQALARFSGVAGAFLAVVVITGIVLGWRILGSWGALVTTPYGGILLCKAALVAAVATAAAWNRFRLLPSVLDSKDDALPPPAADRVHKAVRGEVVGLVVVLLLTGFLVNRVPEDVSTATGRAERDVVTATADDVRVVAHLDPATVGSNTLTVELEDAAGAPLEPFSAPVVSVASGDVDLGSRPVRNLQPGTYETDVVIPEPGSWEVRVSVRLDKFTNPVLTLPMEVGTR